MRNFLFGVMFVLAFFEVSLAPNLESSRKGEGATGRLEGYVQSIYTYGQQMLLSAPPIGTLLNRTNWECTSDSAQPGYECDKAIDGDNHTFWLTDYTPLPHTITINMMVVKNVKGIAMVPRKNGLPDDFIADHQIFLSLDGTRFGTPVAFGTWYADNSTKFANFEPKPAQFVRIVALKESSNRAWTSIAEVNIYAVSSFTPAPPERGEWGPTINFPVLPVAASLQPSGKVVVWSSYAKDAFTDGPGGFTLTATYDPATGIVSHRNVSNTHHDMFCPGLSLDVEGRTIVSGGNDAKKTSIYEPKSESWISASDMGIARGYQSSATCSDGRVFMIGGSFTGGLGGKDGEIYNPKTDKWESLPGCPVTPMLTEDIQGVYRSDNHAMLFAWKEKSVFQAGPSKAMNWYSTTGSGGHKKAGLRGDDNDAMCGIAVMFDAVSGKILTTGGSGNYSNSLSTSNAYIITINDPNTDPTVKKTNSMSYNRIYHNGVVLSNGEVFVTGGQEVGMLFEDTTPQLTPEMYSPSTDTFRKMAPNSVPRTYHSFALLLLDGTVLSGGGGLCGTCDTNHFDAQIYTPPYLLTAAGGKATRPSIVSMSTSTIKVRETLTFKTDREVKAASLIRFGSTTHTVNTDQRRIALSLIEEEACTYSVEMPGDYGVLIPGYWMLFVLDAYGVPSVAEKVRVILPEGEKRPDYTANSTVPPYKKTGH